MAFRMDGKVAIVTGGGTRLPGIGIGCAAARVLAREGASILVVDREEDNAKATVGLIEEEGGRAAVCVADVSSEADCESMIGVARATFGGLDILVNNAGISLHASITETTLDLYEQIMAVNLRGTFMACKHAIPALIERGGGSLVNIGSVVAIRDAGVTHPAYAASKGGVLALTVDLAGEYGRRNVRGERGTAGDDRQPHSSLHRNAEPRDTEADEHAGPYGQRVGHRPHGRVSVQRRGVLHHRPGHLRLRRRHPGNAGFVRAGGSHVTRGR